ncbi:hypothetical protein ACKI14_49795, partial [Streptomyces turgidiscabies]|uniref:hypothetical protein n=1 Tax=Streptomyces turgidiscabies TaxID=85558 RepID=UPI0038F5E2E7
PNGLYVWLATDNGLYGYIKSTNSTNLIEAIPVDTNGLSGTWTNATSTNYQTLDAGGTNVFSVDSTINFANLNSSRPVGVNATYY